LIAAGRPAAITAERIQMQGGVPIQIGGTVVGVVGVSGFDKTNDVAIAETAAAPSLRTFLSWLLSGATFARGRCRRFYYHLPSFTQLN